MGILQDGESLDIGSAGRSLHIRYVELNTVCCLLTYNDINGHDT